MTFLGPAAVDSWSDWEVALLEAAVNTDHQNRQEAKGGMRHYREGEEHAYTAGVGLTPVVSPTTS